MTPEELEAHRQDRIATLPLRHKIARWWDIYALPLAAAAGIFCLAGLLFFAWLRVLS